MKQFILLIGVVLFTCGIANAQSDRNGKEAKWLENQLNTLISEKQSAESTRKFEINDCACKYTAAVNNGGFNMSKNHSFDLKEVSSVNYSKNDNNTYELRIKLKTDKEDSVGELFDMSAINATLHTSDERQVKEIARRFKAAAQACNTGK